MVVLLKSLYLSLELLILVVQVECLLERPVVVLALNLRDAIVLEDSPSGVRRDLPYLLIGLSLS